ncbi:hypothetical protein [Variovorax sp. AFSI2.2]|uniref:hypothetical protein n=1 Tax=Variovorax sp. AFSI2.2 TaxID=3384160 RepID=UPI003EB9A31C
MQTEYRAVASFQVEDEATGNRQTLTHLKKFEVRHPHPGMETAGEIGGRLELADGEIAARIDDNRFRAGERTFRRVLA